MKRTLVIALAWVGICAPAFAASNILSTEVTITKAQGSVLLVPSRAGRTNICVAQLRSDNLVYFYGNSTTSGVLTGFAQSSPAFAGPPTMTSAGVGGIRMGIGYAVCLGAYDGPLYGTAPINPNVPRVFSVTETW